MNSNYWKENELMDGHNIEITFPVGVLDDGVDDIEYSRDTLIDVNQSVQTYISTEAISQKC